MHPLALYRRAIGNVECCSAGQVQRESSSTSSSSAKSWWNKGKSFLQNLLGREDSDRSNRTQRRAFQTDDNNQPDNCVVRTSKRIRKKSTKKAK
jgi:hypothetical protein